jgi:hypothetical protein
MRKLATTALGVLALSAGAAGAQAPQAGLGGSRYTDIIEGPLLRPERSSPDPRDLSGVWFTRLYAQRMMTTNGRDPPFTDKGRAEWEARMEADRIGKPIADASAYCWPHGVPRIMNSPYPLQIIQSKGETTIIHEVNHNIRHIYMDEPVRDDVPSTFMGTSVGRWEGDTLVVETRGVDDRTWLDEKGITHGKGMKVTERFRKIEDGKILESLVRIEDPEYFTEPWWTRMTFSWRPDMRLSEYVCEENNRNNPVNGRTTW